MEKLFTDFQKHVNDMTDKDIAESISKAVTNTTIDDFIAFSKDEYGLTVKAFLQILLKEYLEC